MTRDHHIPDDETHLSRRELLRAGVALPAAPLLVSGRTDTAAMSALLEDGIGFRGFEAHEDAVQFGAGGHPSVTVWYDEERRDSLLGDDGDDEGWLGGSADRQLIDEHEPSATATIAAPPEDLGLGGSILNAADGLIQRDYIEFADLNVRTVLADPVAPAPADEVPVIDREQLSFGEALRTRAVDSAGVAYDEDFEETPLVEAREATNATSEDLDGLPDTTGITIAVVDTGVNHADGAVFGTDGTGDPRILGASTDFVSDGNPTVAEEGLSAVADPNGHGTWVAACLAASPDETEWPGYQGYAPDASVLALRALDSDGQGATADIGAAIRYAADEGADIICLSLGSSMWSEDIDEACEYAVEEGAVPIAATGNDRQVTTWQATPASSDYAIGVHATTVAPPEEAQSAYFANIGPNPGSGDFSEGETRDATPDLGAPGTELGALVPDTSGDISTRYLSGTSMAAPCSGGVGALLIATGTSGFEDVRDRLMETARPVPAAALYEVGAGMPSAVHAIDDDEPADEQADARDDDAIARDEAYLQYSNAQGRQVLGLF